MGEGTRRGLAFLNRKIDRAAVFTALDQLMALFIAEMRHIYDGSRVISNQHNLITGGQRHHALAQFQNGQGAQEPQSVNFRNIRHICPLPLMILQVHRQDTTCNTTVL